MLGVTSIEIRSQRLHTIMAAVAKWRAGLGDGWYSSPHGVQILDYRPGGQNRSRFPKCTNLHVNALWSGKFCILCFDNTTSCQQPNNKLIVRSNFGGAPGGGSRMLLGTLAAEDSLGCRPTPARSIDSQGVTREESSCL